MTLHAEQYHTGSSHNFNIPRVATNVDLGVAQPTLSHTPYELTGIRRFRRAVTLAVNISTVRLETQL